MSCHLPQATCYFILFLKNNLIHLSCSKAEPEKIENPRKNKEAILWYPINPEEQKSRKLREKSKQVQEEEEETKK